MAEELINLEPLKVAKKTPAKKVVTRIVLAKDIPSKNLAKELGIDWVRL